MSGKILWFLALVCLAEVVVRTEKIPLKELREKCGELLQMEEDEIENLKKFQHISTDDRRIKCFIRCIMTGMGLMDTDGEFTLDDPNEEIKLKKYFPACKDVFGSDSCEKAVNFHNCLWEQVKQDKD